MTRLSLPLILFCLISCNGENDTVQKTLSTTKENDSIYFNTKKTNFLRKLDTIHIAQLKYFNPIVYYNKTNFDTIYNRVKDNSKIVLFEKLAVYGSNQKLFALFMEHPEYGTASLPNKALFVFNEKGKLLLFQSHCGIFKKLKILSMDGPFLLTSEKTGKGNGTHRLYMFKENALVNVLNTGEWDIHTIDGHRDENEYDPVQMVTGIKDINKDGYNDLEFSTTLIVFCDSKTIRKKLIYHFLFNPKSKVFEPAGNYSFDNNYKLCK